VGHRHRADAYLECLLKEAALCGKEAVESVYIGGGTPTSLSEAQLEKLFVILKGNFEISSDAEFAIEANPESIDRPKLDLMKANGVNRISLGIQSVNDHYLKYLGRPHDGKTALRAYELIRAAGFKNVNVDFMFSFPGQTSREIKQDLQHVLSFDSEHVSFYMLNLEENSRFFARNLRLQNGDDQARQYFLAKSMLEENGFSQYEISNFAKSGRESIHNLNYWRCGSYRGMGMGAHSHEQGKFSWNAPRLNVYMARMEKEGSAIDGCEQLNLYEQFKQAVLIGLRMARGVDLHATAQRFGCGFTPEDQERLDRFIDAGFLLLDGPYLKASPKGQIMLDEICSGLI
jgi:oxygen-independent coproporphyrinogen-3 oxidase